MRLMRRVWHGALAGALALAALFSAAHLEGQNGAAFTPEERRRIVDGELVRRPATRNEEGAHYIGGTSWMRVHAPRDQVWAAVQDVSSYRRLVPGVEEARVERTRGNERLLFLRHRYVIVTASYYATARTDEASHTIHFELDESRPHDVRAGHGFITVDPYRGNESIVTWGVLADVGSQLLSGMFASVIHDWILKVPWCVRGHVEPNQPHC